MKSCIWWKPCIKLCSVSSATSEKTENVRKETCWTERTILVSRTTLWFQCCAPQVVVVAFVVAVSPVEKTPMINPWVIYCKCIRRTRARRASGNEIVRINRNNNQRFSSNLWQALPQATLLSRCVLRPDFLLLSCGLQWQTRLECCSGTTVKTWRPVGAISIKLESNIDELLGIARVKILYSKTGICYRTWEV